MFDARYISAIESCWHIFEFPMHAEKPTIYHLAVHLPDQQLVYYDPDDLLDEIVDRESSRSTTLTAWFDANKNHQEARQTTYNDFPQTWVYDKKKEEVDPTTARLCHRKDVFCFSLCLESAFTSGPSSLLSRVPLLLRICAQSMASSVPTFKDACKERGLLRDDQEWIQCLKEAADMQTGSQLRTLFATILIHGTPHLPS